MNIEQIVAAHGRPPVIDRSASRRITRRVIRPFVSLPTPKGKPLAPDKDEAAPPGRVSPTFRAPRCAAGLCRPGDPPPGRVPWFVATPGLADGRQVHVHEHSYPEL